MCLEFLRYFITRHETIQCPSKTIEVGVVLRFSLVDLSRRRAVLLRGVRVGKVWVESTRTLVLLFLALWSVASLSLLCRNLTATIALAVVPQVPAVVPLWLTVVPLILSGRTATPRPSAASVR